MSKPNLRDHQQKKPTKVEAELKFMMSSLQRNFELVVANMRAQVRAVCIANNISPELFTSSFHDQDAQTAFEAKQVEIETGMMQKYQREAEEKAKLAEKISPETSQVLSDNNIADLIEGEGDILE